MLYKVPLILSPQPEGGFTVTSNAPVWLETVVATSCSIAMLPGN